MKQDRIVWVDVETTGLDTARDLLLEVGIVVTEGPDLREVARFERVIGWDTVDRYLSDFTRDMHTANGLIPLVFEEYKAGSFLDTKDALVSFLAENAPGGKCPVAGSTVAFDRAFMRRFFSDFDRLVHYRSIDVSSFKEIGRLLGLPAWPGSGGDKAHRAIPDVLESIAELRFYLEAWGLTADKRARTATIEERARDVIAAAVSLESRETDEATAEDERTIARLIECGPLLGVDLSGAVRADIARALGQS